MAYRTILASCKVQRGRPGGDADPQDGTVEGALTKEQLASVAEGLFRQNSASSDRDLSWMLLATACRSKSDGMRHTRLADLCPPVPVNGVGEQLGMTDSCQPQPRQQGWLCSPAWGDGGHGVIVVMRASSRSAVLMLMPAACQSLATSGHHMLLVPAGWFSAAKSCSPLSWPVDRAAHCPCRPKSV